jgi:uncharacterized membrane protein YgcG
LHYVIQFDVVVRPVTSVVRRTFVVISFRSRRGDGGPSEVCEFFNDRAGVVARASSPPTIRRTDSGDGGASNGGGASDSWQE